MMMHEAVAAALRTLGEELLSHLDYEERNLETTIHRLRDYRVAADTTAEAG